MVERTNWKTAVNELNQQINKTILQIPSAYWKGLNLTITPDSAEALIALNMVSEQGLPSPTEALKIIENKENQETLDVLRADLTIFFIKRRTLLQANLSPQEIQDMRSNSSDIRWSIREPWE